ncbi:serine hydrolase [Streptomyces sp. NPDC048825]|uniref:serine hydrolase n=1 Tax=Streptomyces sp. NPDC048825 TaxID=3365592 RepID=UPI0037227C6C
MGAPQPREALGASLARALRPVLPDDDARLSVAVLRLDDAGREIASYGDEATFDTASIVKVDILAALLLQAQEEERELTDDEHSHAKAMIQESDNESANVLWRAIGQAPGLNAANEQLGLSSTQGGAGVHWGLTQTTAKDQVRLLRAVFGGEGKVPSRGSAGLNQESRAYIRQLISEISEGQDWGVSAVADRGWALKNGWLKRSTTGLWDINTIGQVKVHGRRCLISVLSSDNASMRSGISLVERAAKVAAGAVSAHARRWPGRSERSADGAL